MATLSAINTLFDGAAWPCHLLNLLLHLFNSVLVYAILRRLLDTRPGALGLAAIFATHPAFSDSVLWVSDVSGLGASFCLLFALYIHMRKRPTFGGSILVSTLYLASMCFKESGLLLPVFMILYDAYSRTSDSDDDGRRIAWSDYALLLAPLGIYGVLRIDAFGSLFPASETGAANPWHLFATAIGLLPHYAAELLFSFRPTLPRAVVPTATWSDPGLYGGAAIAIGTVALAFSFRKTRPLAVLGIVWMSVALLPHLVAGWPETNLFSARYLYLPAIGFLIFIGALMDFAWGTPRGIRAKRTAFVVTIGVIACSFAWIDYERTTHWRNETTFLAETAKPVQPEKTPTAVTAVAAKPAAKSSATAPTAVDHYDEGLVHLQAGRNKEAVAALERSNAIDPYSADTLFALGKAYADNHDEFRATETYFRVIDTHPDDVQARHQLGVMAYERGDTRNAHTILSEALELSKNSEDKAQIARLLATVNALGEPSVKTPGDSDLTIARSAAAFKTAQAGALRDAIVKLKAISWLEPGSALAHHRLSEVYSLAGMTDKSLPHAREAVALAPDDANYTADLAKIHASLGYVVEVPEPVPAAEETIPAAVEPAEAVVTDSPIKEAVPASETDPAPLADDSVGQVMAENPAVAIQVQAEPVDSLIEPQAIDPATAPSAPVAEPTGTDTGETNDTAAANGSAIHPGDVQESAPTPEFQPATDSLEASHSEATQAAAGDSALTDQATEVEDRIGANWSTTADPEGIDAASPVVPEAKLVEVAPPAPDFTEPIDEPGFLAWTWQPGLELEADNCEIYYEDP